MATKAMNTLYIEIMEYIAGQCFSNYLIWQTSIFYPNVPYYAIVSSFLPWKSAMNSWVVEGVRVFYVAPVNKMSTATGKADRQRTKAMRVLG